MLMNPLIGIQLAFNHIKNLGENSLGGFKIFQSNKLFLFKIHPYITFLFEQGCPKIIHSLMIECWHKDKTKRPNFSDIVTRLDELIRSPEFLKGDSSSLPER